MRSPQRGVTLIELMIGLVILVLLLLAALPFGTHWIDGNRQVHARSLLWEGVSQARTLALRNPAARPIGEPAAMLVLDAGTLEVRVPGSDDALWQAPLRASVVLKLVDVDGFADPDAMSSSTHPAFDCVGFDASGLRLPGADGCSDQTVALSRIAVGLSDQDPLYVELL